LEASSLDEDNIDEDFNNKHTFEFDDKLTDETENPINNINKDDIQSPKTM
jgi:hypothetical protein